MAQIKNTTEAYGALAKLFHWVIALAIIFMLALGLNMVTMEMSPDKMKYYGWHKSTGALILIAAALRLLWREFNPVPRLPADMKWYEKYGAHASHFLLYFMMFYMPLVGWAMSSAAGFPVSVFGWFTLPDIMAPDKENVKLLKLMHYWGGWFLIGLISVHFLAALYHHFWHKDNVLRRMLPVLFFVAFASSAGAATPMPEPVDFKILPGSIISFSAIQNDSPIEGHFGTFGGSIKFSPYNVPKSSTKITINMGSVEAEYQEVPKTLRGKEWFDASVFPQAVFESTYFRSLGSGSRYEIKGNLTIKGITIPITLPFILQKFTPDSAQAEGEITLSRTKFGIGWDDVKSVKDDVKVHYKILAAPIK